MLGRVGGLEATAGGNSGLQLEGGAAARWERPHGRDTASGDEDGAAEARLDRGREQDELGRAQALEPPQSARDVLDRLDPVAQAGRVLVAERIGERREPAAALPRLRPENGPHGPGVLVTTTSSPRARR